MGQVLDALVPRKSLDALVPKKREAPPSPWADVVGRVVSPVPAVERVAQRLANIIEGVERPIAESPAARLPRTAREALRLPVDLVSGYIKAPFELAAEAVRTAPVFAEQPAAALRGFAAGVVEGAGRLTPLDAALLLMGRRVGRRVPAEQPGAPKALPPSSTVTQARMVGPEGPVASIEMAPVARATSSAVRAALGKGRPVETGEELVRVLRQAAEEAMADRGRVTRTTMEAGTFLPPAETPPRPATTSRFGPYRGTEIGPAIPEPPGAPPAAGARPAAIPSPGGPPTNQLESSVREALRRAGFDAPGDVPLGPARRAAAPTSTPTSAPTSTYAAPAPATFAPEVQRQLMLDLAKDEQAVRGARRLLAQRAEIDAARKARVAELDKQARQILEQAGAEPPPGSTVSRSQELVRAARIEPPPAPPAVIPSVAIESAVTELHAKKPSAYRRAVTEAEAGPPPPGVDPRMWRSMVAVEKEARRLNEIGIKDARLWRTMRQFWGAEEAARRIGLKGESGAAQVRDLTGDPRGARRPWSALIAEADQRFRYLMDDPRGFLRTEALLAGAGAAAGGLAGLTINGENAEDRFVHTVSGAMLGGLAGLAVGKGASRLAGRKGELISDIETLDTANLLAGPAAIKASLGALGGVYAAMWEALREGRVADVRRGMTFMRNEAPKIWWRTLTAPASQMQPIGAYAQQIAHKVRSGGGKLPASTKVLSFVLRPFIAADRVGVTAMRRMGFSQEEALRFMLNGEPTSWQGQAILRTINSTVLGRMLSKFARVRIGSIERAVEFTPGLSKMFASTRPVPGRFNIRNIENAPPWIGRLPVPERISEAARRARAEFGGTAAVLGTAYGYLADPSTKEIAILAPLAGPAFLPAAAGMAAGKGLREGRSAAVEAAKQIVQAAPQVGEAEINLRMLKQRLIPLRPLLRGVGAIE